MLRREGKGASPRAVVELAAKMAREALTPATRMLALLALRKFWPEGAARGGSDYVQALGAWAQSIRFVREPMAVGEVVQAPWRTVFYGAGDCDDVACAVAAFAGVAGLPAAVGVLEDGADAHAFGLCGDAFYGPRGRITTMIDQRGARAATADILERSRSVAVVSVGL